MSDLIDRQNAIDVLEILADKMSDKGKTVMAQAVAVLKYLQSEEPEQKKGEWIIHENYDECSKCHCFTTVGFNYCPHCGAEMMNEDDYMKLEGTEHE